VSRFFIDHPIVAQVLAILTMIGGAVMIFRLPIAQFPEIAPRQEAYIPAAQDKQYGGVKGVAKKHAQHEKEEKAQKSPPDSVKKP
jgi:hypothetical protein